ncbi:MAG: tetratricopeptide repeat protein [Kiloniellaceae bacterium]
MSQRSSALEEYRRLVAELPTGMAGSVELVARQLSPLAERLLRLGSIPHGVDRAVARVLLPGAAESDLEAAAEELQPLSFVIRSSEGSMLHDNVRAYLFGQWLKAHDDDPDKWGEFKAVNRRLVRHYEKVSEDAIGETRAVAERQRIFHLTGASRAEGFAAFEKGCRAERYRFRLESCEALIKLLREYETILSAQQRSYLDYHAAKLDIDLHHYDKAERLLTEMLARRSVQGDPALHARCLFRLGAVLRLKRDFQRARSHFEELRSFAAGMPEAAELELRALQGLGALLIEMKEHEEAEERLAEAVMLAEGSGRHDEIATAWNALGILRRQLGQPKRALIAFETALQHLALGGEAFRPRQVYNNIGLLYADRADWPAARDNLEKSCEIAREAGDMNGEATALSNLGRVYLALERPGDAMTAAERAILLFGNVHNWYGVAMTKRGMARYYRREGRHGEARDLFSEAREVLLRAGADDRAAEIESELVKLETARQSWGWLRWLLITIGAVVGLVLLLVVFAIVIDEM